MSKEMADHWREKYTMASQELQAAMRQRDEACRVGEVFRRQCEELEGIVARRDFRASLEEQAKKDREITALSERVSQLESLMRDGECDPDYAVGELTRLNGERFDAVQKQRRAERECERLRAALELIAGGSEFQDAKGERNCIAAARAALARQACEPENVSPGSVTHEDGTVTKLPSERVIDVHGFEPDCVCGHSKQKHIYEDGACRPGFVCESECLSYFPRKESTPDDSDVPTWMKK